MSYPTVFANLPAGNEPLSLFDVMFSILGASSTIPCSASGTNAITVAPLTNYYLPAAYTDYQSLSFVAANNSTGAVTIRLGALAFVKLFMPSGLQANSGDISANAFYIAAFNGALDSGNGGFQVFNASTPSVVQGIVGQFKNLKITNGGTPTTQVAVTADQVMLGSSGGGTARVTTVNLTISTGTNGANGLDAGTVAQNTLYAVYVIFNNTTTAGLLSLSGTSPTLPTGYIYFARVGWVLTGAATTNLNTFIQYGKDFQFIVASAGTTTALPVIAASPFGGYWTAASITGIIPVTAGIAKLNLSVNIAATNIGAASAGVAPNNSYGTSTPNSPYSFGGFLVQQLLAADSGPFTVNQTFDMLLESTNVYVGLGSAGAAGITSVLSCAGWRDNI